MAKPIRISILANASQAQREVNGFSSSLKRTLGAGAALIGVAGVVQGFKSVTDAASGAQQSIGATESIFKQYADTVVSESERAADKYGLSANEYRENANLLGALFKGQGVDLDKLAGKTEQMIGVAADLSAQFGGSTKEAVEALSSAFKGETDPIERYGISIKQSDVNARLAAKGQDELTGAARKQAEQIARTELILKGSADAQGTFAKESDTLAGSQQRLTAQWKDAQAELGQRLLPVLTDVTQWLSGQLPRAMDATENAFDAVGDVVGPVVDLFESIPGPLKSTAAQAAVAALVLPRLTGALAGVSGGLTTFSARLRQTQAELTYAETRTQRLQAVTAGLGSTARTVAGIGGMVALTQGLTNSNSAAGALQSTVGGAALGFSVGGPLGAGIGATAGLLSGVLVPALKDSGDASADLSLKNQDLIDTLNELTGATTKTTRAVVAKNLQDQGLFETANSLGIPTSKLVTAALEGEGKAYGLIAGRANARVSALDKEIAAQEALKIKLDERRIQRGYEVESEEAALDATERKLKALKSEKSELEKLAKTTKGQADEVDKATKKQQAYAQSLFDIGSLAGKVPKKVSTKLETPGFVATKRNLAEVVATSGDLDRKQIALILKAVGSDASVKEIRTAAKKIEQEAAQGGRNASSNLRSPVAKSFNGIGGQLGADLRAAVSSAGTTARTTASSSGSGVGSAMGAGIASGIASQNGIIQAAAEQAVLNAERAAKARAEVKSPSRLMARVGKQMGAGLAVGMKEARPLIKATGRATVDWLTQGLDEGASGVRSNFDKVIRKIGKTYEKTTEKDFKPRMERAWNKWLTDATKGLQKKANAYQRQLNRVARQQQRVTDLIQRRNQFAASVRSSIVAEGSLTQFGQNEDGTVSLSNLIDQLKDQAQESKRFQALIQTLTKRGLNKTAIQQLLDAGVEGGLATAEALASGGKAAVKEVNKLQGQISTSGKVLGTQTSKTMYDAGIKTAQGLLRGMKSQQRQLERQATRMARAIAKAVKKALKIKSPSGVFEDIGGQVTDGLVIGLDDYRAAKAGKVLAGSLVDGFDKPTLRADTLYDPWSDPNRAGTVSVRLTADQVSALQRGRAIQMDLDAYRAAGGRVRAV